MTTVVKTGTQPSKTKPPTEWECPYCKHDKIIAPNKGTPENFKEALMGMRDSIPEFNSDVAVTGITDKTIADNVNQYIFHQKNPDIVHNSKTGKWRGHGQKDIHDYGDTQDEKKAVMAVSSPDDGETCNCQHGDHSNANGQQHGMFNQDLGRANWQGQGLPQPKQDKDSCQCDEKPAEHDKVPNADARISDKEMKKPKKKGGFQLNYDDWNKGKDYEKKKKKKKIKKEMTPAQLEARKKKKPYKHTDLRRRKYRDKKLTRYISDLEEGGDGILREGKLGRNDALAHGQKVGYKRRREAKERKIREGMEALDKKIKALANIIKRNKKYKPELFIGDLDEEGKITDATRQANIHAAKRRKRKLPPRTVNEHEGRVTRGRVRQGVESLDKKIKALEDIIKKKKKGKKRGAGKKWMKGLTWTKPSAPKLEVEAGQAGGDVVTAPVKQKKPIVEEGRAKIETADEKASKLNRQAMQRLTNPNIKRKKIPPKASLGTKTPAERKETLIGQNRDPATGRNIPEKPKKKKKKKDEAIKADDSFPVFGDDKKKKRKERNRKTESTGEMEKRKLMANLSPAVLENMKRVEALNQTKINEKDQHQVRAGKGRGKQIHDKLREEMANKPVKEIPKKKKPKPKTSKFDFFNRGSAGKTFDWDAFWKKHGLKKPEKKEKAEETPYYDLLSDKPKRKKKPTKVLYRDLFEKAEEGMENILAERRSRNAHRAGNTPKKFAADRFRDYLLADLQSQDEKLPLKMTEAQLEEKKRKKTHHDRQLINAKRRKTGYNVRSRRKAEENQFGAWGQRGLGDGSGTGAIQGAGDTHLITPVKAEKLNELMRGLRYMPRSVSRKRKK